MSCYFRHMKDVLAEAGIEVTPENKKKVDQAIHRLVAVEYKDCSPTWKAVKDHIKNDEAARNAFIDKLKQAVSAD
ncbi:MAG: hypothetical protein DSY90_01380 [Deltaproteobacteria bacterium]|nr:MAG: hypothetical protein DSY90_01380 [Deltaproteobacteria bacterium]